MRSNSKSNPFNKKAVARMQYKNRQVDKFIKWSINVKGYLKLNELLEYEKQYE